MTEPLHLPMAVAPELLLTPEGRLRCKPYSAVLSARTCVARRDAALGVGKAAQRPGEAFRRDSVVGRGDYGLCRACQVGETVRGRVGHLVDAPPVPLAVVAAPPRPTRAPRTRLAPRPRPTSPPVTKTRQEAPQGQELPARPPVLNTEESGMRQVQMNGAAPAESATVPAVKAKRAKRAKAARPKRKQGARHCGRCGSARHDTRTCLKVAIEADGTHESRRAPVVHRDVKPQKEQVGPPGLTETIDRLAEKLLRLALERAIEKVERALAK